MKKLSVVVPLYNEERFIGEVLRRVLDVKVPFSKEVIVVDDGSTDGSRLVVEGFVKRYKNVKLFSKVNGGKGSAVKVGIKHSTGEVILIQDSDLELDPKDYPVLLKPFEKGAKVVYGSRFLKNKHSHRYGIFMLGNLLIKWIIKILFFTTITDEATGYKVFSKELKHLLVAAEADGFDWEAEITAKILRKGYKIVEVPIHFYPRKVNEGKKIKVKDGFLIGWTMLKWRFKPFR